MNFHYFGEIGISNSVTWYRYGNLGVQLFFIVSGFVIVQSLEGKTFKEFAKGRFVRLFPLFWFLCTITFLLTLVVPYADHVNIGGYLTNMTMLPDLINKFSHGTLVDASYWTLTVELLFYVGIGLFCSLFSYKNIRIFLGGWLLVSIAAFAFHADQNFYVKLLLVRHASYFIFGSSLALIATKHAKNAFEKYFDWMLLGGSALYSLVINTVAIPPYINVNSHDSIIVTCLLIIFFAGIPLLVYVSSRIKNKNMIGWLALLGGLTYPVYLLHQRIGTLAINYFTGRFAVSRTVFVILFEVIVILLAYVIYRQDKKVRAWLGKKIG
ncbi:MAG: hypothetical protein JWM20_893 [Patescibacteria group bacterium]|nr:hypothetical protein [Patescibacteria group bacterium]